METEAVWSSGVIPITKKELKKFQDEAEMLAIYRRQYGNMVEHALRLEDKIEAVKTRIAQYEKLVTMPDPADLALIEDVKKTLEIEG